MSDIVMRLRDAAFGPDCSVIEAAIDEIERLRSEASDTESQLDAFGRVSPQQYEKEIKRLRQEAEHQSETDAFRCLGLQNEINRLRSALERIIELNPVPGRLECRQTKIAREALSLLQAQRQGPK